MNYDDPEVEETWCKDRRSEVTKYLSAEGVQHGRVAEWPAWHVAPYVSLWAIESKSNAGSVGWWVLCGDLPTDYVSAKHAKDPRLAIWAIAQRWSTWTGGQAHGPAADDLDWDCESGSPELARLLASRARLLMEWAEDPSLW